jgi:hypothetical protein
MTRSEGIPADQLSDDDLERELGHLHETRHETLLNGTEDALEHHTRRMLELEGEFLRRFPLRAAPDPDRTRAGARARAGQPQTPPAPRSRAATPAVEGPRVQDVLPDATADDTDAGWGQRPETDEERAQRYLAERPPHYGD